jgi:hypothetical protein
MNTHMRSDTKIGAERAEIGQSIILSLGFRIQGLGFRVYCGHQALLILRLKTTE